MKDSLLVLIITCVK